MDSVLAHYCLHELKLLPSQVVELPREEKAFLLASIELWKEEERKQQKKLRRK